VNVHPRIGNLLIKPEGGVDWALLRAFQTDMTLDDLDDLEECDRVERSWRDAAHANAEHAAVKPRRRGDA
jgi:hypothetical protein